MRVQQEEHEKEDEGCCTELQRNISLRWPCTNGRRCSDHRFRKPNCN